MNQSSVRTGAVLTLFAVACASEPSTENALTSSSASCEVLGVATSVGGVASPDHIFGEVTDASLLEDSSFVVVDRQAREVHVFGADGALREVLGGSGEGPGEFLDPIAVDTRGERVFVWDWRQSRVTEFDLASGGVFTHNVSGQVNPSYQFGLLDDGFVVGFAAGDLVGDGGEFWTTDLGVGRVSFGSETVDTTMLVPDQVYGWVDQAQRRVGSPHFSPRASLSTSGGVVYWSRGDVPALIRAGAGGHDTIRWEWPSRPVGPGDVELYRQLFLDRRDESMHAGINRMFAAMPAAEVYPAVAGLMPDNDGGIWVQAYSAPHDTSGTWLRIEDGVTCRVTLPRAFVATDGGKDWLLGVVSDDLGVQRVERWMVGRRNFDS